MSRTVAQKMGIKPNSKALFVNAPADAIEAINLPEIESTENATGEFEYIHLFVKQR